MVKTWGLRPEDLTQLAAHQKSLGLRSFIKTTRSHDKVLRHETRNVTVLAASCMYVKERSVVSSNNIWPNTE